MSRRSPCCAGFAGDLQQAAGVGRDDRAGPGAEDIRQLAAAEPLGHFGLGQVVGARRPAAEFRFGQFHEHQTGDLGQQPARGFANFLRVDQVASVVVGGYRVDAPGGGTIPSRSRNSWTSCTLAANCRAIGLPRVVPMMAVIFEHRSATGHVHDHGVEIAIIEGGQIRVGKFAGRRARAGVEMNRPAAALSARNEHIAAVFLKHSGRGPIRMAEHHIRHAAGEQGHPRPACALGGQKLGQSRPGGAEAAATSPSIAADGRARAASGPSIPPVRAAPAAAQSGPGSAVCASARDRETGRTESSDETNPRSFSARRRSAPSPPGTARSACHIARRRDRPFRRRGNRGRVPSAAGLRSIVRAGRRSPPA